MELLTHNRFFYYCFIYLYEPFLFLKRPIPLAVQYLRKLDCLPNLQGWMSVSSLYAHSCMVVVVLVRVLIVLEGIAFQLYQTVLGFFWISERLTSFPLLRCCIVVWFAFAFALLFFFAFPSISP